MFSNWAETFGGVIMGLISLSPLSPPSSVPGERRRRKGGGSADSSSVHVCVCVCLLHQMVSTQCGSFLFSSFSKEKKEGRRRKKKKK